MKKIIIELFGEGCQIDTYDLNGDLADTYVAMRDGEYNDIIVRDGDEEKDYSTNDFGENINPYEWPEDIYDWETEKFIDPTYVQFQGKKPEDIFKIEDKWINCNILEPQGKLSKIMWVPLKGYALVNIEIPDNETFDPQKFHFLYGEFVLPECELEVNTGVVYDGKLYKIDIDPDSEYAWGTETLWEADEDKD